jgi:hypothetical protein
MHIDVQKNGIVCWIQFFLFQKEADGMEVVSIEEVPTEEMIERMEERLELATSQQKNLFLIIFQVDYCFFPCLSCSVGRMLNL